MHHWVETGDTDPAGANPADVLLLHKKIAATGIRRVDYWGHLDGRHEATFALNLKTLELHQPDDWVEDHDHWKKIFDARLYLTGTIDWLVPGELVCDLKTGRWPVSPNDNPQLRSYGLFDWVELGRPKLWAPATRIVQWPKYPIADRPRVSWGADYLSPLEMMEHLDDLRWAADHPDEINPDEYGEEQCQFCDARPACPAWSQ